MALILREQPDKSQAISLIAKQLEKIAMLWQIPNWTIQNAVILAEWTYENYQYEPLEVIINAIRNPQVSEEKMYRLTPDVVTGWMSEELERQADQREKEHSRNKENEKNLLDKPMLPENASDEEKQKEYVEFYKKNFFDFNNHRAEKEIEKPKHWSQDPEYQKFKFERKRQQIMSGVQQPGEVSKVQE